LCRAIFPGKRRPKSLVIDSDIDLQEDPRGDFAVNRYYDPTTDQFLSIDPNVVETGQPYVFTNDNPLNAMDPLDLLSYDPCSLAVNRAGNTGDQAILKTLLPLVGLISQCCRKRRPKMRPAAVRDVSQNQSRSGLRNGE
jgi:uncharacterized protein RhaS with RHS repeats